MQFVLGQLAFLIPLAIVGAVIYAIVTRRRRTLAAADPGIGTVRRLYFYVVSLVALMMAANGVVQMAKYVLEALFGDPVLTASRTGLAIGASLTIVGLPLWWLHWRAIQRYVGEMSVEAGSLVRKLYVYLVLGVALGFVVAAAVAILQWAFGSTEFTGYPWAALAMWSGVWAFHWRQESAEGLPTTEALGVRRLYLYLVSPAMLVMLALGFGRIVHIILLEGYEAITSLPVLVPPESGLWRPVMRTAVALALVGSAVWGAHWLYFARRDFGSILRQVYLYIFTVLGGVITVLVALGFIINGTLTWLLGAPPNDTASDHFRFLPGALASLTVGVSLWAYHWAAVRRETEVSAHESRLARRSYAYILAALGLAAMAFAIVTLVSTAIAILSESASPMLSGREVWRTPVAMIITLVVLGLPLWGRQWASIVREVEAGDADERNALARRIFIFAVLGAGALALLGSVSFVIFIFLREVLEGRLTLEILRDARAALSVMAAVALFLPYHWMVYRRDRRAGPEIAPPTGRPSRKEVSVLVNEEGRAFIRVLEAALGYKVDVLLWADPEASLPQMSEADSRDLVQRIGESAGSHVLLVPDGATVRVLSYE